MMKKTVILLALALMLSALAGCNNASGGNNQLVGTWTVTVDLAPAYETMLSQVDQTVASHIDLAPFDVVLTLELQKDGSYSITANADQIAYGTQTMKEAIRAGLESYLEQETGMDAEKALALTGTSLDELMTQYFDSDLSVPLLDALESSGTYELEDDELTLTDKDGSLFYKGACDLDEDTLVLEKGTTGELIAHLLPVTLEKE